MTVEDPKGPFVLCCDGSESAERAIRVAPVLVRVSRDVVAAHHRPVVIV